MPDQTKYALISHESAVDGIWSLAAREWQGVLDDENIWLVPAPELCVKNQRELQRLASEVDLAVLGLSRTPLDLLVPSKSCHSRGKLAHFHVWSGFFPPRSFVRVHDRVFVSTPYFAVLQLASAQRPTRLSQADAVALEQEELHIRRELGLEMRPPTAAELLRWNNIARFARAVQVLSDFSGTYRFVPGGEMRYQTKPIMSPSSFRDYLVDMDTGKGIMRAREVAKTAFAGSASPMETMLALILSLPVEMGGFGLPRPELNVEVPADPTMSELCSGDTFFADLSWPSCLLEYYGWRDHMGMGPKKVGEDAARANSLVSLGHTVLHATFEQVRTYEGISLLARQVAHALGVQLQKPTELERIWRSRLLALLLPKEGRTDW